MKGKIHHENAEGMINYIHSSSIEKMDTPYTLVQSRESKVLK
jgi:hypothetical protein